MLARITRSIMLVCLVGAAGGGAAYADLRLVEAAKAQQWDTVGRLLVAKVDVTTSQPDGATALHLSLIHI